MKLVTKNFDNSYGNIMDSTTNPPPPEKNIYNYVIQYTLLPSITLL